MSIRPSRAHFLRFVAWCGYALLISAAVALRSVGISQVGRIPLIDVLIYLLPIGLVLIASLWLAVRVSHAERRLWLLIAGISILIFSSESYITWYCSTVDVRGPNIPAPFQLLQLGAVVLVIWVLARLTALESLPVRRALRLACDALGGVIVLTAVVYWFVTLGLYRSVPDATWRSAVVSAAYPVVGFVILISMTVVIAVRRTYRWRSWERLLVVAFALYGVGLIGSTFAYVQIKTASDPQASVWATVALGFGYYVMFMATVYRATSQQAHQNMDPGSSPLIGRWWYSILWAFILGASFVALGISALRVGDRPEGFPIVVAAAALALVLISRSWVETSETVFNRNQASMDSLTGLFNGRYLRRRLTSDLAVAKDADATVAVISFGIGGLKTVSDLGGPDQVNRVVATVARALSNGAEGDTTLCTTTSDLFVLIARGVDAEAAFRLAEKLLIASSRDVESHGMPVALSAGIAMFPASAAGAHDLLSCSSQALAIAAKMDGLAIVVYDSTLTTGLLDESGLTASRTQARRTTMRVLASAVDARDSDNRHHSDNIADLVAALALVLDLPAASVSALVLASHLHDVGKIGVPDSVLRSSGSLSHEQRQLLEQHPVLGERILSSAGLTEILPAVRHHHEHWDGSGYPDGLSGTDIPVEARILAVCDAYESLIATGNGGGGLSASDAVAEIERCTGTQFDPDVAAPFCRMIGQIHSASPRGRAGLSDDSSRRVERAGTI
ncbi:MAG: HD domain-containing phosphohydrolase [Coriobacteriia bacterium]